MLKSIFAFLPEFIFYLHKYQKISKAHRFYWTKCCYPSLFLPLSLCLLRLVLTSPSSTAEFFFSSWTQYSAKILWPFSEAATGGVPTKNLLLKPLCWGLIFNKVAGLQACNFIEKILEHRCFLVDIAKVFKKTYFVEHLQTAASAYSESVL